MDAICRKKVSVNLEAVEKVRNRILLGMFVAKVSLEPGAEEHIGLDSKWRIENVNNNSQMLLLRTNFA